MNRETIKKAALNYVEQYYPANHPFKKHDVNVFMQGALCCINTIWHTDLKEAQTQRKVLVEFAHGNVELFGDKRELHGLEDLITRYAYVDELLPNTEK